MEAAAKSTTKNPKKNEDVNVTVTFPLAGKGPYKEDLAPGTLAGTVRASAMTHFGVADDQTTTYYLTHKGDRVDANATVGELADEAKALKFTLAKELIQG